MRRIVTSFIRLFRNNYERALSQMPNILSQATVEELEVWITNRNNATQNVRDVVAFMDMGEISPYSSDIQAIGNNTVPDNGANDLYSRLTVNVDYRRNDQIINVLQSGAFDLNASTDYEKFYAQTESVRVYARTQLGLHLSIQHYSPTKCLQ